MIDEYISKNDLSVSDTDYWPQYDKKNRPIKDEVDLKALGVKTVIWAGSFKSDYAWLEGIPIFDEDGNVQHKRGITQKPGIYFIGLEWLYRRKSSSLMEEGEDAGYIADAILNENFNLDINR